MVKIHTKLWVTDNNSFIWVGFYCGIERERGATEVGHKKFKVPEWRKEEKGDLEIRQKINVTHWRSALFLKADIHII